MAHAAHSGALAQNGRSRMTTHTPLNIFIYPNTSAASQLATCTNSRHDKDLFETKLVPLLSTGQIPGLRRVSTPAQADLLYHPACLVDFYFRVRNQPSGRRQLLAVAAALEQDVAALGYSAKPHIVNALRCRTVRGADDRNHVSRALGTLWTGRRFRRFCTEATTTVDPEWSIHLPYCPPHPARAGSAAPGAADSAEPPPGGRSLRVVFIGSPLFNRKRALAALHRQNFSRRLPGWKASAHALATCSH